MTTTKNDAGTRGKKPAAKDRGEKKKLTLLDRVHRAERIAAERSKKPKTPWPKIAKQEGISQRQAERLYDDFLRWGDRQRDPTAVVDELVGVFNAAMVELDGIIADADQDAAKVGAIRLLIEVVVGKYDVLRSSGRIPVRMGAFRAHREAQQMLEQFARVLTPYAHLLPKDAWAELERVIDPDRNGRPAIEGKSRAA